MKKMWISFTAVLVLSVWAGSIFADGSLPRVVFDQGHNQQFLIGEKGDLQLSNLADIIRGKGAAVTGTADPLNDETLIGVTALVVSGPFQSLKPEEIDAVTRFVERGGRLAAMLHIGPPLAGLLDRLDIDHSNSVLHERNNIIDKDINFRVKGLGSHVIFTDLSQFSVYGGWALKAGKEGTPVAHTSAGAWVDLDGNKALSEGDAVGGFDVVVAGSLGSGSYLVFGDDAIFQNRFLDGNNSKLAANLAGWLLGR